MNGSSLALVVCGPGAFCWAFERGPGFSQERTTEYLESLLHNVSTVDPLTYGAVATVLATVALLAAYLPAMRASRVDPITVLRNE